MKGNDTALATSAIVFRASTHPTNESGDRFYLQHRLTSTVFTVVLPSLLLQRLSCTLRLFLRRASIVSGGGLLFGRSYFQNFATPRIAKGGSGRRIGIQEWRDISPGKGYLSARSTSRTPVAVFSLFRESERGGGKKGRLPLFRVRVASVCASPTTWLFNG